MAKFKPFHEFQKSLMGFTPEAFLDYVENGTTERPSVQISQTCPELIEGEDPEQEAYRRNYQTAPT
ncbi:hypothetical protein B188_03000 [Candidatus Brocadiaceae bacterium B188]|nr:hypothetical protein [Candidatus Brocadia sapporoensis]QQR67525.1 MAG: hypothetical protein IPI25_04785 [Candidatus Brocadia sp.]RZV58929.1 MAG: hypothetical protein EX330_03330 [Candidatus Brocadia sp. BROELEC01]TWU52347.1 hypothetical protein B188_03000 [Candidatus Brocadiaceae bacterium B188]